MCTSLCSLKSNFHSPGSHVPSVEVPTEKHGTSALLTGQGQCHHHMAPTKGRAMFFQTFGPPLGKVCPRIWRRVVRRSLASPPLLISSPIDLSPGLSGDFGMFRCSADCVSNNADQHGFRGVCVELVCTLCLWVPFG